MAYQKPLDLKNFALRDLNWIMFAVSLVLSVGIHTNWGLALTGAVVPLLALKIISLGIRARTEQAGNRLARCGAVMFSLWAVILAPTSFFVALWYVASFLGIQNH